MADVFRWEDRHQVQPGDTITWQYGERPLMTGVVDYTADKAVYVNVGQGSFQTRYRVPWADVVLHTARNAEAV
jgi:hypothetical protein